MRNLSIAMHRASPQQDIPMRKYLMKFLNIIYAKRDQMRMLAQIKIDV